MRKESPFSDEPTAGEVSKLYLWYAQRKLQWKAVDNEFPQKLQLLNEFRTNLEHIRGPL
jgi:hypothetical protein